jgi:hypothetical protein
MVPLVVSERIDTNVTCSQYGCVTAQVRNFAVKLLLGSDQSFRGEYLQYNLGKPVLAVC